MPGSVCSYFEGTEKKLELTIDPGLDSLRTFGDAYWTEVARAAGADVLSKLSNDFVDAYLLSESSMFVFDHRVLMMTCGQTKLTDSEWTGCTANSSAVARASQRSRKTAPTRSNTSRLTAAWSSRFTR